MHGPERVLPAGGKEMIMMKKYRLETERSGFHGVWYPAGTDTNCAMILMLGDDSEDLMAKSGAKWIHRQGCHALAMSPSKKDYGHHEYPLERFEQAIRFLKSKGCEKIGIVGASTTGMLALCASSYFEDLTLTIALTPSDFIMEGFYRDNKDGMKERPGDNESSVSYKGKGLPYLPYAYRHPQYWQMIEKESKETGNMTASRNLFDESERLHPLREEEKIKVENIHGRILFIGAEDDVLWDTCRYIRRMQERLNTLPHTCTYEAYCYEHGTHFVFPQSFLDMILPVGTSKLIGLMFKAAKQYSKECRKTREDIDLRITQAIRSWKTE